jgi:hypothetical protein
MGNIEKHQLVSLNKTHVATQNNEPRLGKEIASPETGEWTKGWSRMFTHWILVTTWVFVRLPSCIPNQSIARGRRKPFRASGLHILPSHRHSRNHRHSHSRHLKLKHMKTTCLEPPFQKETGIKCYRQKRKSCLSHAYGASPHGTAVLKSHAEVMPKGLSCMAPRSLQHAFNWCGFTMFLRPFLLF